MSRTSYAFRLWPCAIPDRDEEDEIMTPPERAFVHLTVLKDEVVRSMPTTEGACFVDVTLGGGGHTEALLLAYPTARVIGCDRDPVALAAATARLAPFGDRFTAVKTTFSGLPEQLAALALPHIDGIVADLGISSPQIDEPSRGMSFRAEGPLDMRMDGTTGETAAELIARLDASELADVLFHYGEERRSRRIARCIKQADEAGELVTTLDLRRAVVRAVGPQRIGGVDPATRTFQALRIAVNQELDEIESLLAIARRVLALDGVLSVISFHSLEDRLVKRAFQDRTAWAPLTKKPITPSEEECTANPRARSAKLRSARRLEDAGSEPWATEPLSRMRVRAQGQGEPR